MDRRLTCDDAGGIVLCRDDATRFSFGEEVVRMPYILVETLPDGVEEADVVTREEYESVVAERDSTMQQRDDALQRIVEAEQEVRDTKARYADAILSAGQKPTVPEPKRNSVTKPKLTMSTSDLFGEE